MEIEQEIASIKAKLRRLGTTSSNNDQTNSLEIVLLKVNQMHVCVTVLLSSIKNGNAVCLFFLLSFYCFSQFCFVVSRFLFAILSFI